VQPRFAIRIRDAVVCQQLVEPLHRVRAAVAMVGVMEAERAAAVVGERQAGGRRAVHAAQGQQQEAGRVGEGVSHRPQAGMAHGAEADQRPVHANASDRDTVLMCWRMRIWRATHWPETKPSS
jgi:hypothetical protein